ncbi:hypothetical protein DSO57_1018014 [Entomophthora muscae]|uniref:Uncharacterized protein n=1 Tax=Entomophthora muscae TaxID=34485 RepID=A0ACC2TF35_9FUNG|nr:hypothetical protein DSO57_1018014 [Entomophthora muscae]
MASDSPTSDAIKPLPVISKHGPALATELYDTAVQSELYYPDKEEIEEDQLHRILSVNALT